MRSKILGLLAVALLAGPISANATLTNFVAQGPTPQGTILSGTFTIDILSSPLQICEPLSAINLMTIDQPNYFRGQSYSSSVSSSCDQLVFENDSAILTLSLSSPLSGPGTYNFIGIENFVGAVNLFRGVLTTTPSSVPAPVPLPAAAWLLLSGLAGLGFLRRRKAA